MGIFDWLKPKRKNEPPPPKTLEEAGDRMANDLVETLNWLSEWTAGGVPGWFDKHANDVRQWWRLRRENRNGTEK